MHRKHCPIFGNRTIIGTGVGNYCLSDNSPIPIHNMTVIASTLACVPIRAESAHRSEMVSQLIFGEKATVLESHGEWLRIQMHYDNYTGWIESGAITELRGASEEGSHILLRNPLTPVRSQEGDIWLPAGSEINPPDSSGKFFLADHEFRLPGNFEEIPSGSPAEIAKRFLHAPYLWGGRTVMGIDCSGFTQIVFKLSGISLPRDASDQALEGAPVAGIDNMAAHDLIFFSNDEGTVSHVGIYLGEQRIIHASKQVRIDRIDSTGIFNAEMQKHTHRLHSIRRLNSPDH